MGYFRLELKELREIKEIRGIAEPGGLKKSLGFWRCIDFGVDG